MESDSLGGSFGSSLLPWDMTFVHTCEHINAREKHWDSNYTDSIGRFFPSLSLTLFQYYPPPPPSPHLIDHLLGIPFTLSPLSLGKYTRRPSPLSYLVPDIHEIRGAFHFEIGELRDMHQAVLAKASQAHEAAKGLHFRYDPFVNGVKLGQCVA